MGQILILLLNGVEVMKGTEQELNSYLLERHSSISHALKHEGYEMRNFKDHVVAEVTTKLANRPWFRGVCCDRISLFREDWEKIEDAIQETEMETMFWDAPNCGMNG